MDSPLSLSPAQSERVRILLDGEWHSGECAEVSDGWPSFDRLLSEVQAPEELHVFADKWNWDGGTDPIKRVLDHPLCDRGTALMVYWRIDPIFYLKAEYNTREKVREKLWPAALVHWDMLRQLEERLTSGQFASSRIAFDPTNDRGRDRTKQRFRKKPPRPIFKEKDGKFIKVGETELPEEPEIDVRSSLPDVVFQSVPLK